MRGTENPLSQSDVFDISSSSDGSSSITKGCTALPSFKQYDYSNSEFGIYDFDADATKYDVLKDGEKIIEKR